MSHTPEFELIQAWAVLKTIPEFNEFRKLLGNDLWREKEPFKSYRVDLERIDYEVRKLIHTMKQQVEG